MKERLGITKDTERFLIINPPGNFLYKVGDLDESVKFLGFDDNAIDFCFSFLTNRNELEELFPILKYKIKKTGIIWIAFPKDDSELRPIFLKTSFVKQVSN